MANEGKKHEKRTHKWLEDNGWLVHTVQPPPAIKHEKDGKVYWATTSGQDLFGLFDHVAVDKGVHGQIALCKAILPDKQIDAIDTVFLTKDVIFVQTKSRKQYGKDLDKYKDFPYLGKYIFVWIKGSNGRYNTEPIIQVLE